jgi:hypothetical protein
MSVCALSFITLPSGREAPLPGARWTQGVPAHKIPRPDRPKEGFKALYYAYNPRRRRLCPLSARAGGSARLRLLTPSDGIAGEE